MVAIMPEGVSTPVDVPVDPSKSSDLIDPRILALILSFPLRERRDGAGGKRHGGSQRLKLFLAAKAKLTKEGTT
jgi:hypothetical protein